MALWGISTTTELSTNNYNIPKYFHNVDKNRTPHNVFADLRGWVQRHYKTIETSGLSTHYYDEVIIPISGLTTTGGYNASIGSTVTGLGLATPTAVFFEDPNRASNISVGSGGTSGITTGATGYVHLALNEIAFVSVGATINIRTFDANDANESTPIVATASSISPTASVANFVYPGNGPTFFSGYNGQITNRPAFAFTAPSTVLVTNVNFLTTTINSTVSIGSTVIYVGNVSGVSIGSSISVVGPGTITTKPVVAIGDTYVTIGTASTVASALGIGTAVTFSTRTSATKLKIDLSGGFVGVITDIYDGAGITSAFSSDIIRNVGGAGGYLSTKNDGLGTPVGIGTTTLTVTA